MSIPLEDSWVDVIGKARSGLGLSTAAIAGDTGLDAGLVGKLFDGQPDANALALVAGRLGLHAASLVSLAGGGNQPAAVQAPEGVIGFNTPFDDMTVNNYLIWDPASRRAAVFDTGTDIDPLLEAVQRLGLHVDLILLTHSHGDHVLELDRLKEKTGAPAFIGDREPLAGAESFPAGQRFAIGALSIGSRLTWGHSPGGISYLVHGLAVPVAVCGDSLFARSAGGGRVSYPDALATIRAELLTLPPETLVCPGHGPLTTIGDEAKHNPFFAP